MALFAAAHSVAFSKERFDSELFEEFGAAARTRAAFAYVHDRFCAPTPAQEWKWRIRDAARRKRNLGRERRAKEAGDRALREEMDGVRAGTALGALHWLGRAWFGLVGERENAEGAPADRLRAVVDPEVAGAAEEGLRNLAARGDVPSPADLALQATKNEFYTSNYSVLAGADLLCADAGTGLPSLPPERLAALLCLALVTQTETRDGNTVRADERPWVDRVASALPDEAARAVRTLVVPQLEAGTHYVCGLRQLCEGEAFAPVRARLLPDLLGLASSPHAFDLLSRAALRELPPASVLETARRRLDLDRARPMAERWPWLVLAWRLDPAAHAEGVRAAVGEDPALLQQLARATGETITWGGPGAPLSGPQLTLAHRELVLRLTGPRWPPAPAPEGAWSPPEAHDLGHFVFGQLDRLAALPGPEAEALLVEISDDTAFAAHRDAARHVLAVRRREERRRAWEAPAVSAAARALRSGPPASGPDLLAFAEAHLRDIEASLRTTQDNRWRGFWNTDGNGRPTDAKVENVCRDHVLTLLRAGLQAAGVSADTEVRFPVDDRCDIVAHALGRILPVEVKCDWHRELWSAWRGQLAARYAAEPRAAGLGVYLVLWFGDMRGGARALHAPPGGGDRPSSAADLERRLQEAMCVEGLAVRAVVLDASPPPSAAIGGKPRARRRVGRPR